MGGAILRCVCLTAAMLVPAVAQQPATMIPPGVHRITDQVSPGYVLVSPLSSNRTFLLNNAGQVVHFWQTNCKPGQAACLLEDGSLLRAGKGDEFFQFPATTGSGGRIQKYDWEGNLTWDVVTCSPYRMAHHDIEPLPNGNVLCIVWESFTREVAEQAGRAPHLLVGDVLWFDAVFELQPTGPTSAKVVWRWSVRDHLIQDWDETRDHFGNPAEHPERVDINYMLRPTADWIHMNSIAYHAEQDQIMLCSRSLSEFWIIDHSTTTEEAKGRTGGRSGRGGDLLYRWGNPAAWRMGDQHDRMLFHPHDAHWIAPGLPGAGNVLLFNNGLGGTEQNFSSADELVLPVQPGGTYAREAGKAFGPEQLHWTFEDPGKLFSPRISGAQRLPNGNTLICSGTQHLLLEVTQEAKVAWLYQNPPRFHTQLSVDGQTLDENSVAPADLPEETLNALRTEFGIPLEDGGTMFQAHRYPVDYPAFVGRDLTPKVVPPEVVPPDAKSQPAVPSKDTPAQEKEMP